MSLQFLTDLRSRGAARFAEAGLPTQRLESWKYTGLNRLKGFGFEPTTPAEPAPEFTVPPPLLKGPAHRLVFVGGRFDPDRSLVGELPPGVVLGNLAALLATMPQVVEPYLGHLAAIERRPMVALNAAWVHDGFVVIVPPGVELPWPVEATFMDREDGPQTSHPRHLIVLAENAGATILERHAGGSGAVFTNAVTEIDLAAGARLRHYVVHAETAPAVAVETIAGRVARDAAYRGFALTVGGGVVRRDIEIALAGPGASAHADGAFLVDGDRHADATILIDHQAPRCVSRQTQKGVVDGHGRSVFQGKILVRPDAQKTDGHQLSQTLLLSPDAEMDVKPELEIHADDVKCSHGATIGRLDAEALFFLRARGIPGPQARALLIEGFIGSALDEIDEVEVRDAVKAIAAGRLAESSAAEGAS